MAVREAAREFAQKECLPGVIERDRDMIFPKDQVKMMAELGFLGMMVSPEYGGGGMDTISYALAMEEISKLIIVVVLLCPSIIAWYVGVWKNMGLKNKRENTCLA
jgi:alkylation response protein AidB-like acyl-CoA dehydrogenase